MPALYNHKMYFIVTHSSKTRVKPALLKTKDLKSFDLKGEKIIICHETIFKIRVVGIL